MLVLYSASRALRVLPLWAFLIATCLAPPAFAQDDTGKIVQITVAPIPGLADGNSVFADVDGDGDLDWLLTGDDEGRPTTQLFLYADTLLSAPTQGAERPRLKYYAGSYAQITGVRRGGGALGDLNGDGLVDVIVAGLAGSRTSTPRTDVYLNQEVFEDSVRFARIPEGTLPGIYDGTVAFAPAPPGEPVPYVLLCGARDLGPSRDGFTGLYRPRGAGGSVQFDPVPLDAPGLTACSAAWGDYDRDGDPDLAISGDLGGAVFFTQVYRNDGGSFTRTSGTFVETAFGSLDWGDYDGDGDLDLLTSGGALDPFILRGVTALYRNESGAFTRVETDLPDIVRGEARFLDFDGDGVTDVALAGEGSPFTDRAFGIYVGDGAGGFAERPVPGVGSGADTLVVINPVLGFTRAALATADYNGDGDDDVVVFGIIESIRVPNSRGGYDAVPDVPTIYFIQSKGVFDEKVIGEYSQFTSK